MMMRRIDRGMQKNVQRGGRKWKGDRRGARRLEEREALQSIDAGREGEGEGVEGYRDVSLGVEASVNRGYPNGHRGGYNQSRKQPKLPLIGSI